MTNALNKPDDDAKNDSSGKSSGVKRTTINQLKQNLERLESKVDQGLLGMTAIKDSADKAVRDFQEARDLTEAENKTAVQIASMNSLKKFGIGALVLAGLILGAIHIGTLWVFKSGDETLKTVAADVKNAARSTAEAAVGAKTAAESAKEAANSAKSAAEATRETARTLTGAPTSAASRGASMVSSSSGIVYVVDKTEFDLKANEQSALYVFPPGSQCLIEWTPSNEDLLSEWHYGAKEKLVGGNYRFVAVQRRGVKFVSPKDLKVTLIAIN